MWDDKKSQRNFLDWAGTTLNVKKMEDWYKIQFKDIVQLGGKPLLYNYNNNVSEMIPSLFPEFSWELEKFPKSLKWNDILESMLQKKRGVYFLDETTKKEYFKYLEKYLGIVDSQDWKHVSSARMREVEKPTSMSFQEVLNLVRSQSSV